MYKEYKVSHGPNVPFHHRSLEAFISESSWLNVMFSNSESSVAINFSLDAMIVFKADLNFLPVTNY